MPPVDTWHPQVRRWVHAAWEQAGGLEGGRLQLAQLVRALWASGDPWSRAYRHLFAGAPPPAPKPVLVIPDDEVFYSGEADLVALMEEAARLGGGRIHPWTILGLVAERTRGSAQRGSPGVDGVRTAPVEAVGEGTIVRAQRGASPEDALEWAGGRQVVAVLIDERVSSGSAVFATPYVEGHFHLLADDAWVLREPSADAAFWVLEGVSPDSAACLMEALRQVRRRVPGFVPWVPLKRGLSPALVEGLTGVLSPLRSLPRLLMSSDADGVLDEEHVDALVVALDTVTGGSEAHAIEPVLGDHPDQEDVLDHTSLARSLASTLAHPDTAPPYVLAVLGPSGSGRTDLLTRVQAQWLGLRAPEEGEPPPLRATLLRAPEVVGPVGQALADHLAPIDIIDESDPLSSFFDEGVPTTSPDLAPPDPGRALVSLLLPGADTAAPRTARTLARAGLACAALGGAGVWAAPPDWSAFVPAALLGAGLWMAARGIGSGLYGPAEEAPIALPEPVGRPELADPLTRLPRCERLMVLIDDLDRVSSDRARQLVQELQQLLASGRLPPTVVVLAGTGSTIEAACPPERPLTTFVQVPLWLGPLSGRVASRALGVWTGLPAPRVRTAPPVLHAVVDRTELPGPVPIHVEADDTGEIGPADLEALISMRALVPPSPRAWKRLLNQTRLLRPLVPPGTPASAIAAWLALAAADPGLPAALRARLAPGIAVADILKEVVPPTLRRALADVEPDAWPDAETMERVAVDVLRWTFAGPYAPVEALAESAGAARRAS